MEELSGLMGKRGLCQLDHSELQLHYGPSDLFGGLQEISEIPVLFLVLRAALQIPKCFWTPQLPAVGMLEVRGGAADPGESQCWSGRSRCLSSALRVLSWLATLMGALGSSSPRVPRLGAENSSSSELGSLRQGCTLAGITLSRTALPMGDTPMDGMAVKDIGPVCALPAEVPGGVRRPSDRAQH